MLYTILEEIAGEFLKTAHVAKDGRVINYTLRSDCPSDVREKLKAAACVVEKSLLDLDYRISKIELGV